MCVKYAINAARPAVFVFVPAPRALALTSPHQAGREFDPISDALDSSQAAPPSKWGLGTLLSLGMLGSMVWQMGGGGTGQPWSPQSLVANLKNQSPIHLLMMFNMLSGLLF